MRNLCVLAISATMFLMLSSASFAQGMAGGKIPAAAPTGIPSNNVYQIRTVIGDSYNTITETNNNGRSRTFPANTPGFDTGNRPVWDMASLKLVLESDERRQANFYATDLAKNRANQENYGYNNTEHRSHHVNETHTTVNGRIDVNQTVNGTVNVQQTGRVCGTYNCHCAGRPARTVYYTGSSYYYDCPHRGRVYSGTPAWNWNLFTPQYASLPYVPTYVYRRFSGLPLTTWSGPARIVTSYRGP